MFLSERKATLGHEGTRRAAVRNRRETMRKQGGSHEGHRKPWWYREEPAVTRGITSLIPSQLCL